MKTQARILFRWKQTAGLLCLLVYLFGGARIAPGLMALGATLEGTHQVRGNSTDTDFKLVLHHPTRADGTRVVHPHGAMAKVFCLLASENPADPDHILQMVNGGVSERNNAQRLLQPAKKISHSPVPALALSMPAPSGPAHPFAAFQGGAHPPPIPSAFLSAHRVTVLVI